MKRLIQILLSAMVLCAFNACNDGNENDYTDKKITIDASQLNQTAYADDESVTGNGVSFTTTGAWTSSISESATRAVPGWISIDPDHGDKAGDYTININLESNTSGADRTATVTITCGAYSITITVTQKGETEGGGIPKKPKLITRIKETTATGNSAYFEAHGQPYYYEFQYDNSDRLTGIKVRKYNGTEHTTYVYGYDVAGEVNVYRNNEYLYTGILGSDKNIARVVERNYEYDDPMILTYTDGYLSRATNLHFGSYNYIWGNGNLLERRSFYIRTEWDSETETDIEYEEESDPWETQHTYSTALNDKANLDLNIFFFGMQDGTHSSGYEDKFNLFAISNLTGKRCANFLLKQGGLEVGYPISLKEVYTETTEPQTGVLSTRYNQDIDMDSRTYTFDSDNYPLSYSFTAEITKYVTTYGGVREYVEPENEEEEQYWRMTAGEGPWFLLKTETTSTTSNDTYTYTISYNE